MGSSSTSRVPLGICQWRAGGRSSTRADRGSRTWSALGRFGTLVAERSYRVTAQEIAALERRGYSADEISRRSSWRPSVRRSGEWTPLARRWAVADLLLDNVEAGHDRPTALFIRVTERITGMALPDVVKVTCYRHRFFGTPFADLVQEAMRGPSF